MYTGPAAPLTSEAAGYDARHSGDTSGLDVGTREQRMSTATVKAETIDEHAAVLGAFKEEVHEDTGKKQESDDDFVVTDEQAKVIKRLFEHFDKNGNGMMERKELAGFCKYVLGDPLTRQDLEELYDSVDTDGSGHIHFEEFINYWRDA